MSLIYGSTNGHRLMRTLLNPHWLHKKSYSIRVWPNFAPRARFVPGSVHLIRPVLVLSLAVAQSTARPNRQPPSSARWPADFDSQHLRMLLDNKWWHFISLQWRSTMQNQSTCTCWNHSLHGVWPCSGTSLKWVIA